MQYVVTTFYKFISLPKESLDGIKATMVEEAARLDIHGLILIAEEGVNGTIAGGEGSIEAYKKFLDKSFEELRYQDSPSEKAPFKRFKVKIKPEIVHMGRVDMRPDGSEIHIQPDEWDQLLEEDGTIVIDVRNTYETKIGTFKGAVDPRTEQFSDFPEWVKTSGIPKDTKVGIFCTGGIRCEKAALAMKEQGYSNVSQLDGGILQYMQQRPDKNFVGECFVFDHRSAVGQDLAPSQQYAPCWMCGNSGSTIETCDMCTSQYHVCKECSRTTSTFLCSKNCRYKHEKQMAARAPEVSS